MRRLLSRLILLTTLALLVGCCCVGCADEKVRRDNALYRERQQAGGQLPWNRPQSWEGNPMGIPMGTR